MSATTTAVAIVGIVCGMVCVLFIIYGMGRDIGFFKEPQCLGWGRLFGHKYSAMGVEYIQNNCQRCGKKKES